ncbi:MAG: hypothetical protein ACI8Y4_005153, partial [Candidatus Poriferisodalaceae bacterium]
MLSTNNDTVEADATMTRALDPKVTNAIWTAI